MRESDSLDRIEMALLSNLANRALADHARKEAAQRAIDMVDVRKWRHDWRRKHKTLQNVEQALRVVK